MAKREGQKRKLLYVLEILQRYSDEQHPISTQEIIERLSAYGITAERKSIYSDVEELSLHGYDIITVPSRSGGGYYLGQRDFEIAELKLMADAIAASRFMTTGKSRSLIQKIESLASVYDAGKLKRQVAVAGRAKTENERVYYSIDAIHTAIQENKKISFVYLDWNMSKNLVPRDDKLRIVSPWALIWREENYYLLAFDNEDFAWKHYRVDKLERTLVLEENREGRELFEAMDLGAYVNQSFGMYGGQEETVTMRFHKSLLGVVMDRFGKDVFLRPDGDTDYFLVRSKIHLSGQFYGWLCGLGRKVTIVSPVEVENSYREWLNQILQS